MVWEHKKARSVGYLNKYKDEISQEAYNSILYVIGTQALEDIFVTEESVKNMIRLENGEIATDELIKEIKAKWKKEQDNTSIVSKILTWWRKK